MPTVIADVGAANANSYVTVAEADTYFGDSFGKDLWAPADTATKESLVITASRTLDLYIAWVGEQATDTQSMEWPRSGTSYEEDEIPSRVKYAVYELAYYMLENNGISFGGQTVDSVKVGPIAVDFTARSTDAGIPSFIESMLGGLGTPIIFDGSQVRMAQLVRT